MENFEYPFPEYLSNTQSKYEQFCINYINEKFQQFFVKKMVKEEEQFYEMENLGVPKVPYFDNETILGRCDGYTYIVGIAEKICT